MAKRVKFKTELVISSTGSGWHFLLVDGAIEKKLGFEGKFKRVVCSINGEPGFQCALMPWETRFYIIVNKQKRDGAGIVAGDMVAVVLEKDVIMRGFEVVHHPLGQVKKAVLKVTVF